MALIISGKIEPQHSSLISAPSPNEAIWQKGHPKARMAKTPSGKGKPGFVPPAPRQTPGTETIRTIAPPTPGKPLKAVCHTIVLWLKLTCEVYTPSTKRVRVDENVIIGRQVLAPAQSHDSMVCTYGGLD